MDQLKFYRCRHCGNIISFVHSSGIPVFCCGEQMEELKANEVDASQEKHVPVISRDGDIVTVTVGSVLHPFTPEHHIEWICLVTKYGRQRKLIPVGKEPIVKFALLPDDEVIAAYEYCNLHGLWKK